VNESGRVEAFSDGVIAIAITLLVLEVRVPEVEGGGLGHALAHQWPSYAAYVLTFLLVGIMWVNHHAMFREVERIDRTLLFLNIGLLMAIAFLPFPTALVARYIREGNDGRVATAIYSFVSVVIGCGFLALWWYLMRHPHLLRASFGAAGAERAFRRTIIGPVAYAVSILVALIAPLACLLVYAAIALYFVFPVWSRPTPATAADDERFE
jgi:uncharacterized membrane protein